MNKDRPLVVRSYLTSLPPNVNSQEKIDALTFFAQGAAQCGDDARTTNSQTYEPCDVGAIIGNAFSSNPSKTRLSHYLVRKMVIETQTQLRRYWLSIDSNVFIYKNSQNPHRYLRYSFNSVFPKDGIYCNENADDTNWKKIKKDYNMDLQPWRSQGQHILLALQRPKGWSMRGEDFEQWLTKTLTLIRKNTDRPIIARWHPGNWKDFPRYQKFLNKQKILISPQTKHITEDLKNCWALVCHNSTPSSVSVIEGIPSFITDDPGYCQAGPVANTDFTKLERPDMPDRQQWIQQLAQAHWKFEDVKSGKCWSHMRRWVKIS
jgi:hypothetical protein